MTYQLTAYPESWPIQGEFAISREVKISADTVVVEIEKDGITGRGECVPLKRYQQCQETVITQIESVHHRLLDIDREELQTLLPPGAARNAVDCALWDWQAKAEQKSLAQLMEFPEIRPLNTIYTLSLDTPERMAENAKLNSVFSVLKMKMNGSDEDLARIEAVKKATPHSQLILDANEAWNLDHLDNLLPTLIALDVVLIEQPLPEGQDEGLKSFTSPIPIVADESCHTVEDLEYLKGKYQVVNIKLDKTGGLTHALILQEQAQKMGFKSMVGCMVSTSLSIYSAMLIGQNAQFCDLDGAYLLKNDPYGCVFYQNGQIFPS